MNSTTQIELEELNPHLLCVLCGGYLIDATTIIECIHSFCRTCIQKYLETSKYCPICDVQVHKTKPLLNLRSDKTLQTLVYKLVPGLFKEEMKRRREFYASHTDGDRVGGRTRPGGEERGEVELDPDLDRRAGEESISLELQHCVRLPQRPGQQPRVGDCRFLLCPAGVTVDHLRKFLRNKFDLPHNMKVEVFVGEEGLRGSYTLLDVAQVYGWRRTSPLKIYYVVYDATLTTITLSPPKAPRGESIAPSTGKKRQRKPKSPERTPSRRESCESAGSPVLWRTREGAENGEGAGGAGPGAKDLWESSVLGESKSDVNSNVKVTNGAADRLAAVSIATPGGAQGGEGGGILSPTSNDLTMNCDTPPTRPFDKGRPLVQGKNGVRTPLQAPLSDPVAGGDPDPRSGHLTNPHPSLKPGHLTKTHPGFKPDHPTNPHPATPVTQPGSDVCLMDLLIRRTPQAATTHTKAVNSPSTSAADVVRHRQDRPHNGGAKDTLASSPLIPLLLSRPFPVTHPPFPAEGPPLLELSPIQGKTKVNGKTLKRKHTLEGDKKKKKKKKKHSKEGVSEGVVTSSDIADVDSVVSVLCKRKKPKKADNNNQKKTKAKKKSTPKMKVKLPATMLFKTKVKNSLPPLELDAC